MTIWPMVELVLYEPTARRLLVVLQRAVPRDDEERVTVELLARVIERQLDDLAAFDDSEPA